jgi:small multidrug resistance family-3 protein
MQSFIVVIALFVLAGLLEIGGGYLIWLWLREGSPVYLGLLGAVGLALYGVVATLQPFQFGRVFAAYGGVFIVMAVFWGWVVDQKTPDAYDWVGAGVCVIGVCIMLFAPRG